MDGSLSTYLGVPSTSAVRTSFLDVVASTALSPFVKSLRYDCEKSLVSLGMCFEFKKYILAETALRLDFGEKRGAYRLLAL
eukprot:6144839-Amphidinium_carterae.1